MSLMAKPLVAPAGGGVFFGVVWVSGEFGWQVFRVVFFLFGSFQNEF